MTGDQAQRRTEPSLPELARTALAQASIASLVTTDCSTRSRSVTVVTLEDQPDGRPLVRLANSSPTVRQLVACPVATVSVAGCAVFRSVELTGPLNPCRPDREGFRTYRVSTLSVRLVGATGTSLSLGEFHTARPDPLLPLAAEVLEHLGAAHAGELLGCIRSHGHPHAEVVVPRALDRYGIELAAICPEGVHRVRLLFPDGPVESLDDVRPGLLVPLTCHCHGTNHP